MLGVMSGESQVTDVRTALDIYYLYILSWFSGHGDIQLEGWTWWPWRSSPTLEILWFYSMILSESGSFQLATKIKKQIDVSLQNTSS